MQELSLERIALFREHLPPTDWDDAFTFTTKQKGGHALRSPLPFIPLLREENAAWAAPSVLYAA